MFTLTEERILGLEVLEQTVFSVCMIPQAVCVVEECVLLLY